MSAGAAAEADELFDIEVDEPLERRQSTGMAIDSRLIPKAGGKCREREPFYFKYTQRRSVSHRFSVPLPCRVAWSFRFQHGQSKESNVPTNARMGNRQAQQGLGAESWPEGGRYILITGIRVTAVCPIIGCPCISDSDQLLWRGKCPCLLSSSHSTAALSLHHDKTRQNIITSTHICMSLQCAPAVKGPTRWRGAARFVPRWVTSRVQDSHSEFNSRPSSELDAQEKTTPHKPSHTRVHRPLSQLQRHLQASGTRGIRSRIADTIHRRCRSPSADAGGISPR